MIVIVFEFSFPVNFSMSLPSWKTWYFQPIVYRVVSCRTLFCRTDTEIFVCRTCNNIANDSPLNFPTREYNMVWKYGQEEAAVSALFINFPFLFKFTLPSHRFSEGRMKWNQIIWCRSIWSKKSFLVRQN